MKKLINRLKLMRDFYLRKARVSGLPLELMIEVTNKCNLNCIMCTRQVMKRPIGLMKMGLYKKIINEVAGYLELVYLHGLGEPLYHPKIFEMIKYAKSKGLNVGISINGTLLTKEKSKRLIASGLDYLIFSLDAVTAETFQKIRGGDNFDQVVKNIKEFLGQKKKANQSPFTVIQFVKMAQNEGETNDFKKMWYGEGAEVIRVKPVIDLLKKEKHGGEPKRPCFYLWRQLNLISWNGQFVTPCCIDNNGDYPLGDARQQTIKEIWNSPKMVALRKAQLTGDWKKIPLCQNCFHPQPSLLGQLGAFIFPGLMVKKILPYLEKFHLYD